jgi:hypothetical protein
MIVLSANDPKRTFKKIVYSNKITQLSFHNMKNISLLLLLSILFSKAIFAEGISEFSHKMTYFYTMPSKEVFDYLQDSADKYKKELSESRNGADVLITVVIARISEKHNWPLNDGYFSSKAKEILKGETDLSKFISDDSVVNPSKLDVWCASFFATGDKKYLENIYKYAVLDLPESDAGKMMTIGAAKWSFKANCRQHKRVEEFAVDKLETIRKTDSGAKYLQECITHARSHKNRQSGWIDKQGNKLPDEEDRKASGNFGAQLIFISDEQTLLKRWATPSKTVMLDTVDSVEINEPISAFIVFSGCKPSSTGNCNVSMRFKVTQPDGKIYTETPAMEVWQDKPVPPRHTLELSAQYLKVIVEPHEQRGNYTVQTQVRDENAEIVLSLQKTFTVSDTPSKSENKNTVKRGAPRSAPSLP